MAIYSLGVRTSSGTAATPAWEIRTAVTDRAALLEMGVFLAAATASTFGLGRPAVNGAGGTTPVTFPAEDPGDPPGTVQSILAGWSTTPTAPANFFRRIGLPGTIGTGVIWTFPRGLKIAISTSFVLWVIATSGVVDAYAVEDE